jgi:WXG100 family type VII secretion target
VKHSLNQPVQEYHGEAEARRVGRITRRRSLMSGAGSNFRAELSTMHVAAQHVYDVNAQIQSQLSALLARLDPLMGTWQGSAATSFQALKERWHQDATQLNGALKAIGDGLVKVHDSYNATEDNTQQSFTSITRKLGG